jgi:hypothetical protein
MQYGYCTFAGSLLLEFGEKTLIYRVIAGIGKGELCRSVWHYVCSSFDLQKRLSINPVRFQKDRLLRPLPEEEGHFLAHL